MITGWRRVFDEDNDASSSASSGRPHVRRADRQGQLRALHAEGDLRAARGDRRHAPVLHHGRPVRSACPICRSILLSAARHGDCLRHGLYAGLVPNTGSNSGARAGRIDVASEFRYREAAMPRRCWRFYVSQSGETADTLAALAPCQAEGQHIVSVVNVAESSMARESDVVLPTLPDRRSASPQPRRSPPSLPCWPAWRSPRQGAGRSMMNARRTGRRADRSPVAHDRSAEP